VKPRHILAITAGLALGGASLATARGDPGASLGGASIAGNVALLVTGWALVLTGVIAVARRPSSPFGFLLGAAGGAWLLAELDNPGVGSAALFTLGLVSFAACAPLVAHAALVYERPRLEHLERVVLALAYLAAIGLLGLASALVYDPARSLCSQCPANVLAVSDDPRLLAALQRDGLWLGLVALTVLAGLAAWRIARSSSAARILTAPVLAAAIAYLGLVAADYAHSLQRGFLSNDAVDERLWMGQAAALGALALAVVVAWVRGRRARDAMARIVVELGEARAPAGLRDALSRALGDPELELVYPVEDGGHVDAAGQRVEPAEGEGRAATPLVRGGHTVAVLVHRAELRDDPGLLEEVGAAASLALEHERLQAELRAQLEALRASQARTVEAGDAERRRLERDLHDGAQQRLVVLSLALRLLREHLGPAAAARLDAADSELREALADLRELGRGIYPAVLVDEGLAAAVEALAEDSAVPLVVGPIPGARLAAPVEAAAYFLVAEVVKRSGDSRLAVSGTLSGGRLAISVAGAGELDGDLADLEDRIGAVDGELTIERDEPRRLAVRAEVPCGSS
jgi:signal transduction histidine kinase